MKYTISILEIKRRQRAYLTLCVSLISGLFLGSIIFQFKISVVFYAAISGVLWLIGIFSTYFFNQISKLEIMLSAQDLQRNSNHSSEKYLLTNIKKVQIKWTAHNSIREIYLWMKNQKSVFLTGLNDFEKFRIDLLSKLDKQTIIGEWREPLNFDSQFFYPILGLIISNAGILIFKFLLSLNQLQIRLLTWLFMGYLFIFGLYFLVFKPISARSGNLTKMQDYLLGGLMLLAGVIILLISNPLV